MSFPGMRQDDKGNIKVNLGIASIQRLAGFYRGIGVFCLYSDTELYNNRYACLFKKFTYKKYIP